jgi:hypothetical protein
MSFSPSNRARTASASQFSGRRRSFMKRAHRPPRLGRSPVARSTPWLSTCTRTWSLRNPGSAISTTSCASPACFHSTSGSKSSNARVLLRRRSMVDGGASVYGGVITVSRTVYMSTNGAGIDVPSSQDFCVPVPSLVQVHSSCHGVRFARWLTSFLGQPQGPFLASCIHSLRLPKTLPFLHRTKQGKILERIRIPKLFIYEFFSPYRPSVSLVNCGNAYA